MHRIERPSLHLSARTPDPSVPCVEILKRPRRAPARLPCPSPHSGRRRTICSTHADRMCTQRRPSAAATLRCHTPQRAPEEQLIGALARASQPPARPADWRGWRVGIAPGAGLLGGYVASVAVESQGYLQADRANAEPVTDIRSLVRARMLSRGGRAGLRWRAWL